MQPFGGSSGSGGLPPPNPPNASHLLDHHHHPSSSASSSTASSSSSLADDILKLSTHLKQETLYVQSTKRQLVQLHEEVSRQAQSVAQQVWVAAHQRQNAETIHSSSSASSCMQRSNAIEAIKFVDAYRTLGHADVSRYGDALEKIRSSPRTLAAALIRSESASWLPSISGGLLAVARVIVTSMYNSCLMPEDEAQVLTLLAEIIGCQVSCSPDPRRLIRKSNSAFHITFKLFSESLYAARLFLTASLYEPIMRILMDDEWFYDIDPDKAVIRFPASERLRRFGRPDGPEHAAKVARYREFTVNKLYQFANRFIHSLRSNMYCFPQSVRVLVNHLYASILKKGGGNNQPEALAVCADLVFSLFICPAICDPEPLGITKNISISYISRHNLMQVAQILQVLVVSKREDVDPKVADLYSKFQANSLTMMIESLLDQSTIDGQSPAWLPFELGGAVRSANNNESGSARGAVLMTPQELGLLLQFLRQVQNFCPESSPERSRMDNLLVGIPESLPDILSPLNSAPASTGLLQSGPSSSTPGQSPSSSPHVPMRKNAAAGIGGGGSASSKKPRSKLSQVSAPGGLHQHQNDDGGESAGTNKEKTESEVLTIPIGSGVRGGCDVPGMLSETKVLTLHSTNQRRKSEQNTKLFTIRQSGGNVVSSPAGRAVALSQPSVMNETLNVVDETASVASSTIESVEKRTRFSFSHGEHDSIDAGGCPSEYNLEAISEAGASNQSVASSTDFEANCNDNDNLSDMISANVSGRGTPNVSGRDTPLSQVEGAEAPEAPRQELPGTYKKEKQDISESFYKFEIRNLLDENETKSVISDSWSTDVVASDFSEPPESSQIERLEEIAEEVLPQGLLEVGSGLDRIDACSEAWSTDVLASDSEYGRGEVETQERLNELKELDESSLSGRCGRSLSQEDLGNAGLPPLRQIGPDDSPLSEGGPGGPGGSMASRDTGTLTFGDISNQRATRYDSSSSSGIGTGLSPSSHGGSLFYVPASSSPLQPQSNMPSVSVSASVDESHATLTTSSRRHKRDHHHHHHGRSRDTPLVEAKNDHVLKTFDPLAPDFTGPGKRSGNSGGGSNNNNNNKGETGQIRRRSKGHSHKSSSSNAEPAVILRDSFQSLSVKEVDSSDLSASLLPMSSSSQPTSLTSPTSSNSSGQSATMSHSTAGSSVAYSSASQQQQLAVLVDGIATSLNLGVSDFETSSRRSTFRLDDALSVFDPLASGNQLDAEEENADARGMNGSLTLDRPASITPRGEEGLPGTDAIFGGSASTIILASASKSRSESSNIASLLFNSDHHHANDGEVDGLDGASADGSLAGDLRGSSSEEPRSSSPKLSVTDAANYSVGAGAASGAIPKSFSFGDGAARNPDQNPESGGGGGHKPAFLKKIPNFRIPSFKGIKPLHRRGGGNGRNEDRLVDPVGSAEDNAGLASSGETPEKLISVDEIPPEESSDSILEKYRSHGNNAAKREYRERVNTLVVDNAAAASESARSLEDYYDPYNLEGCPAFADAKRKLRMVLASADYQTLPTLTTFSYGASSGNKMDECAENYLLTYLKVQLAEAINLGDKDLIAQLHETLRCVRRFDNSGCVKLIQSIQEDYHARSIYVAYLVETQRNQLTTLAHLRHLGDRVQSDKRTIEKHFVALCVRQFLEKYDRHLLKFISEFQKISVMDEKVAYVEQLLNFLYAEMDRDSTWQVTSEAQLEEARLSVERNVMGRIYSSAVYPNGDGDVMRDEVLSDHIKRVSKNLTPDCPDLSIPKAYHPECPWPSAQAEIITINAYKTPRDKVQCVVRCCHVIQNLLKMANQRAAGADDIVPVLIFVIIKANPSSLLSTIQYVTSFYERRLSGEEEYWWAQFTGAVMFIKMMGNSNVTRE